MVDPDAFTPVRYWWLKARPSALELPIEITAEILPGKVDPAATARFANGSRADQYAQQVLIPTGDYTAGGVWLTDSRGTRHRLDATSA